RVDETIYPLLPHGRERKRLDRQEMAERCVLQFLNEAMLCWGERILRHPRDGDVGAVYGLGFPPFLGGPFHYVDSASPAKILERLEHWRDRFGVRFEPAPALRELVRTRKTFH
ncbi:MAG TPA: fatty acid oxidation complex subunit alpha FadJ, partial [Myxococcaceae bacterium]|nr:fatty acid oxidation complex subunit alpha FadJ [Myxococcaceae bacterium]